MNPLPSIDPTNRTSYTAINYRNEMIEGDKTRDQVVRLTVRVNELSLLVADLCARIPYLTVDNEAKPPAPKADPDQLTFADLPETKATRKGR